MLLLVVQGFVAISCAAQKMELKGTGWFSSKLVYVGVGELGDVYQCCVCTGSIYHISLQH